MNKNILVVDDEQRLARVIAASLQDEGYTADTAHSCSDALRLLKTNTYFLVLTDLKLPDGDGLRVLKTAKELTLAPEVILMTAYASAQTAVEAMKLGAYEYVIKPFETAELIIKIGHIHRQNRLNEENRHLKEKMAAADSFEGIIGKSRKIQDIFSLIEKVAEQDVTVLIRGESGTGKEMVARAIHQRSGRADKPFVTVNCGALPETLLESELFGYEKGAFTGAGRQKPGHFESAGSGTIFLDEIGDVSPAIQVKLLRVLENKTVTHLGGTETIPIGARIVTATNRDLEQAMAENQFREDLYYRLNVFPITLPPLRDRKDDIPYLVEHFLDGHAITDKAMDILSAHRWTGNIRELQNSLQRARILAGKDPVTPDNLPETIRHRPTGTGLNIEIPDEGIILEDIEKDLVIKALNKANSNKTEASRLLGITRRMLYSKLEKYGLTS